MRSCSRTLRCLLFLFILQHALSTISSERLTNNRLRLPEAVTKKISSMDHRGLLFVNDEFYVVGGMGSNQKVLDTISRFQLKDKGK